MTKYQPPRKSKGKKKVAPKKAAKSKPVSQQAIERTVRERLRAPLHPTVEEQYDSSDRYRYAGDLTCHTATPPFSDDDLPAPKPPGPLSKFWRQYQDTETGEFIGFAKAATLAKNQVISRLRLRKPKRAD